MSVEDKVTEAAPQNAHYLTTLAATDHAPPALQQTLHYLNDLHKNISATQREIKDAEMKTQLHLKDHEKYRDSTVRRFAHRLGGSKSKERFAEKADKEEREYYEAAQAEHQAKDRLVVLQQQLEEAHQQRCILEKQVKIHREAQQGLDALYESIFGGSTPEFPEEDSAECAMREARSKYDDLSAKTGTSSRAVELVSKALEAMDQALVQMQEALKYSRADIWIGGSWADALERNALSKAQNYTNQVQMHMLRAQHLRPEIADVGSTDIAQGNLISDVLFDNIFSSMNFHEKIKDSDVRLKRARGKLVEELNKEKQRKDGLNAGLNEAREQLESTRSELQRVREQVFRKVTGTKQDEVNA
ncbi:hypothetical protein BDY21DRAFT_278709 [Lineolata rhizophorae]|uniref:Uncharacterized protein n=1 Tax=Lineolata rhizophorae TaxID=578093 RepID=A0A6A6PBU9_9PEZI|nr:hypothetical protein BDY21DRAFT_278709 [Lineolata rhizophorae]